MYDVSDLRTTIMPKSDQLNADQLLSGPITITITDVRVSTSDEQPVAVHYDGENGRPYKPCKTMRKVLVLAWGEDGRQWAGRSMTLYTDPTIRFGKDEVGGIRISHLTDIDRDIRVSLAATKGKKALHEIKRMAAMPRSNPDAAALAALAAIAAAQTPEAAKAAFGEAWAAARAAKDRPRADALKAAYDARMAALTTPEPEQAEHFITPDAGDEAASYAAAFGEN